MYCGQTVQDRSAACVEIEYKCWVDISIVFYFRPAMFTRKKPQAGIELVGQLNYGQTVPDILASDHGKLITRVMLYYSSAFDAVDHNISFKVRPTKTLIWSVWHCSRLDQVIPFWLHSVCSFWRHSIMLISSYIGCYARHRDCSNTLPNVTCINYRHTSELWFHCLPMNLDNLNEAPAPPYFVDFQLFAANKIRRCK